MRKYTIYLDEEQVQNIHEEMKKKYKDLMPERNISISDAIRKAVMYYNTTLKHNCDRRI